MSMAPSQLGAFTKSDAAREWANIQYHVQPLSLDAFGEPLHKFPAITASVCNLNPSSRGSVTLKSPDFKVPPAIAPKLKGCTWYWMLAHSRAGSLLVKAPNWLGAMLMGPDLDMAYSKPILALPHQLLAKVFSVLACLTL